MFKYGFIMNSRGLTPETYSVAYQNDEFYCYIAAVHGMKMTRELAKKLVYEGIELIDLCGAYDEEMAQDVLESTGDDSLEVCYAKYTQEQEEKFNSLDCEEEYGIIVKASGIKEKPHYLEMESEEFNTRIALVGSDAMAIEAAKEMIDKGICFIELCSYFDLEKTEAILAATGRKVPIGYCG